jgi:4-amino-4-deoxy-L-arabinose transferase-like glycosyltransferase
LTFKIARMDALTVFGLFAVLAMLVCYALESRSHWFVLLFGVSCALGSAYGFLQGVWPFGLVEAIWSAVALRRWILRLETPLGVLLRMRGRS